MMRSNLAVGPIIAVSFVLVSLLKVQVIAAINNQKDQPPSPSNRLPPSLNRLDATETNFRDRSHISAILELEARTSVDNAGLKVQRQKILQSLSQIYDRHIAPLERYYQFDALYLNTITDAEIDANPLVLFLGPWSTGKSTMINYLLDTNDSEHSLYTGAEPTTTDFTVLTYGDKYKEIEGLVLATDPRQRFSYLEKYGQAFLEKFQGFEMPKAMLERVTIIDTPGIIENSKQQERGYPFNEVMKWFIDRASLIFVVFDPSKLDVGTELASTFKQLKGRESQIRIILNKADLISSQELMRVYGALFWNFAPLINVVEPPRIYVGSFWPYKFRPKSNHDLFLNEEISLLYDMNKVVANSLENKVAMIRQHAKHVYMHALIVDKFKEVFNRQSSFFDFFGYNEAIWIQILNDSEQLVFRQVLSHPLVSQYDLPSPERYKDFFRIHSVNSFYRLHSHCRVLGGCPLNDIVDAMSKGLPELLSTCRKLVSELTCSGEDSCYPKS